MQCPLPSNNDWQDSNGRFGSMQSFRSFVENNNEIFDGRHIISNKDGIQFMTGLLDNLQSRFGIEYEILDSEQMKDVALSNISEFDSTDFMAPKGMIIKDKVYLNKDRLSIEAAFHEYLHPVVELIDATKPEVIDRLWSDLNKLPSGKKVISKITRSKQYQQLGQLDQSGNLNRDGIKEAIVTLVGQMAEQDFTEMLGSDKLSPDMISRIRSFISDLWSELLDFLGIPLKITPETFNENTSLGTLSALMSLTDLSLDFKNDPDFQNRLRNNMFTSFLTDNELTRAGKVMEELNIFLERRIQIAESLKKSSKVQKLKSLKRDFESQKSKAAAFEVVVNHAFDEIVGTKENPGYYPKMMTVIKNIQSKSPQESLEALQAYYNYANTFEMLFQNIQNELVKNGINAYVLDLYASEEGSSIDKMRKILKSTNDIKLTYKNQVLPVLAEVLEPFYNNNDSDSKIVKELTARLKSYRDRLSIITDKEARNQELSSWDKGVKKGLLNSITKSQNLLLKYKPGFAGLLSNLTEASEDISMMDKLLTPAISQSDPVLSSFAILLKEKFEKVRLKMIDLNNSISKSFNEFKKNTGRNIDNVEKFNEGLYEKIQVYHNGSLVTTYAFVQEYDVTKYNKDFNEMKLLEDKLRKEGKSDKADEVRERFFAESREPMSKTEIDKILQEIEKNYSKPEYYEFITKNMYNPSIYKSRKEQWSLDPTMSHDTMIRLQAEDLLKLHESGGKISYQGKLSTLRKSKYSNPNWSKLISDPTLYKYYQTLLNEYLEGQKLLPESQRQGFVLPGIRKEGWDRMLENGVINHLKDEIKDTVQGNITGRDEERTGTNWGSSNLESYSQKLLPIYYTSILPETEVSLDLQRSVILFNKMARKYSSLEEIHPVIQAMENVASNRPVAKTDANMNKTIDYFANLLGYKRTTKVEPADTNINSLMSAFIDMQVYGEKQKVEEFQFLGGKVDLGKLSNSLASFASKASIGGDILKSVANMTQAKMMTIVESFGGELIDLGSFRQGENLYMSEVLPDSLKDMYRSVPLTLHGKIIQAFDPLQGEFQNELGQNISKSTARKMFGWNTWFMGIHAGEHYAQVSMFYGMMFKQKIKGPNNQSIPLAKAYELVNGELKLKQGFDPSWDIGGENMLKFINKVHGINKRLHGVYNSFDQTYIQQFGLGRLIMMFRKFAPPGFKRRFKRLGVNNETGEIDEGIYVTWFNELLKQRGNIFKVLINFDKNLTDLQKSNLRRTNTEITIALLAQAAVFMLSNAEGDDDDYMNNFAEYQFKRLSSEMMFYTNPKDFLRILSSPSASTTKIQQTVKAIDLTFFTYDPDKLEYKRKTGIWDKGDSKTKAAWLKVFGITGYNLYPEEAVKIFDFNR